MITESIKYIRTIVSLASERNMVEVYSKMTKEPELLLLKRSVLIGFINGFSILSILITFALILFLGVYFMVTNRLDKQNSFGAIYSFLVTGIIIRSNFFSAPSLDSIKKQA